MQHTTRERRSRRGPSPAAIAGAVAIGSLALATVAPGALADEPPTPGAVELPVIGSVASGSFEKDSPAEVAVTLHAVRRVGKVTVVYFSAGATGNGSATLDLRPYLGPRTATSGLVLRGISSEATVTDPVHRVAYTPLVKEGDGCIICSDADATLWTVATPRGQARVGYVAVPALPADVQQVQVTVAGRTFQDVPVGDGALAPQVAPAGDYGIVLGTGWPVVDTSPLPTATDPARQSIHPMVENTVTDGIAERSEATRTNFDLSANVLFDKDRAVVRPAGRAAITTLATQLPKGRAIRVTGYTDDLGSAEHGLELSRRRAGAVADVLRPLVPSGTTITTAGKGEADPIASNETEQGRQQNRRVTVTVEAK